MALTLTGGAISMLSSEEWQSVDLKPVLQVLDIRIVQSQTPPGASVENKERYRIMLSDGSFHQQAMLATHCNEVVRSHQVQKGSIVQLTDFVCTTIEKHIIIVIVNLNVILRNCNIIGDPKPFPLNFPGNKSPSMASNRTSQINGKKLSTSQNIVVSLTTGTVSMLLSGEWQRMDLKPVLQVIDIRAVPTITPTGKGDRYRVLLSDGSFHQQGILSSQLNELVTSQKLQKGSIIQLTEFVCNMIRERMMIIIVNLNVILFECDIIGDPKPFPLKELHANKTPSIAKPPVPMQSSVPMSKNFVPQTYSLKTISQIKDEKLGTFGKPDYITVNATVWNINLENFCYMACPFMLGDKKCSKRVVNNGYGKWQCDECDKSINECDYRYILKLQIHDHTGVTWVTAFDETAEEIMGYSAKDLYFMKEKDEDRFIETIRGVLLGKYNFKLKVKEEFLVDEVRVISSVVKADKIK